MTTIKTPAGRSGRILDDLKEYLDAVALPGSEETLTMSAPLTADAEVYETKFIGDGGAETLTMPTPTYRGQRKLVTYSSGTGTVTVANTNIRLDDGRTPAVALDASAEFLFLESDGTNWVVKAATSGVIDSGSVPEAYWPFSEEEVTTSASPTALSLTEYQAVITTGGTQGAEAATIGDGTGAVVGQMKLITLGTLTDPADSISLDHANIVDAAGLALSDLDLAVAGDFVLLEWNGTKWQIVVASAAVVTAMSLLPGHYVFTKQLLTSPGACGLSAFQTLITTSGTQAAEAVTIGNGTGAIIGQLKLVKLGTLTDPADSVSLDHANIVDEAGLALSDLDLAVAGDFVLLRWNGTKWQVVEVSAAVVTAMGLQRDFFHLSSEAVTSGAAPQAVDLKVYKTTITTGATAGSEDVTVGDGTGITIGHRKLILLGTRSDGSDVVNLDHANCVNASGTPLTNLDLDAAGEFVLLEWNGTKWQIVHVSGTVAT